MTSVMDLEPPTEFYFAVGATKEFGMTTNYVAITTKKDWDQEHRLSDYYEEAERMYLGESLPPGIVGGEFVESMYELVPGVTHEQAIEELNKVPGLTHLPEFQQFMSQNED